MQTRIIAAAAALAIFLATPLAAQAGPNGGCTCRHKDGDVLEGQTACIVTPKGMWMARCERVLNNTSWKVLGEPCPTAKLQTPKAANAG